MSPSPPTAAGTLEALLAEGLALAERTRAALLASPSSVPASPQALLENLERSAALGVVTARVTAGVAWLLARFAVLRGELDAEEARRPAWRLLPPERLPEALGGAVDPEVLRLLRESERFYRRLDRLDAALDRADEPSH
ncbi:hypothetical protein HRbin40_02314 [bacterium HR40]|nr:hypothetical protein HRbin40_02314 [bacterium HR40]